MVKKTHPENLTSPQARPLVRSSPDSVPCPVSDAMKARHDTLSPKSLAKASKRLSGAPFGFFTIPVAKNPLGDPERFWRVLAALGFTLLGFTRC